MSVRAKNRYARQRVGAVSAIGAATVCAVFSVIGTKDVPASSSDRGSAKVYRMHRPDLRVRLQVQGGVIFPTRVWARTRCSSGSEGASELLLEEPTPSQEIAIGRRGRFKYEFPARESRLEAVLAGRVFERKITGYYLEWDYEGGVLCGTGQPGDRVLRFVARLG
jgi:hypothetical protein